MGVAVNHAISFLTSPLSVFFVALVAGLLLGRRWRRAGAWILIAALAWLYCMSSGWMYLLLGLGLERQFPPVRVETLPQADAIVVLGGGVGTSTNVLCYTELFAGADRVAEAARLWKAGKAPVIITSGTNELHATRPLLMEFGVPESAILVENQSRNTEQNARFVADYVKNRHKQNDAESSVRLHLLPSPKILLVTSSWHMRRSLLLFRKYAPDIEVIPAACDYEATLINDHADLIDCILPSAGSLGWTSVMLKEYIGYWGYRLLR